MQTNAANARSQYDRVVVIGGGIAGLMAAQVLANHARHVTIVERDELPQTPALRRGVPQARHAHTLLPRGQKILSQLFPGLLEDLMAQGAVALNSATDIAQFQAGAWHQPRTGHGRISLSASRPVLEDTLRAHLLRNNRIHLLQGYTAEQLLVDARGSRVRGLVVRARNGAGQATRTLPAEVVVDSSGRASRAPEWLAALGLTPPDETVVNAHAGYASRLYQRPAGHAAGWKSLYVRPMPPYGTRGGMIIPLEDGRWHVTLIGIAEDYPPTAEAEFLAFARSLPTPALYDAICAAAPLSSPVGFRHTASRMRHFEAMERTVKGYLVLGDAAMIINPVHALGMTLAAQGALALKAALETAVDGLTTHFQQELAQALARPWRVAARADAEWPATTTTRESTVAPRAPQPAA